MPLGLAVAVLVVSGAALGVVFPVSATGAATFAVGAMSLALVLDRARARQTAMLLAIFAVAAIDGGVARTTSLSAPLWSWFDTHAVDGRMAEAVSVAGTLVADAEVDEIGVRLTIDVSRVGERPIAGRIQVHVVGDLAAAYAGEWTAGRPVAAPVWLHRLQLWRNPGSPTEPWQQLRRPCDLAGTVKSGALVAVRRAGAWQEAAASIRRYVRRVARDYVAPHSVQSAAIVAAILIGDRTGLDQDVQRRLQAAGTYHVIAISGGNIAILTTVCLLVLRLLVRSARAGAIITMAIVVAYGWMVGGDPSVRRAVLGACLYLGVGLFGLTPRSLNVFGVVAMIVAAADPLTVIDIGAWLSFGATLGIILVAGRFLQWTGAGKPRAGQSGASEPGWAETAWSRVRLTARWCWLALLGLFAATVSAEIVLLPISAAVFSRVSVAGLVLNFVAIPAMAVVQIGAMVMTALAGWWPGAAHLAGAVTDVAAWMLVGSSSAVDMAPWLSWRVPPSWMGWTILFYAALGAVIWTRGWSWTRRAAAGVTVACLLIITTAPGARWSGPPRGWLRVTMLDVGQGDALLVQFPTGHSLMVDTGGAGRSFDIGGRIVTPAAWASGVTRLDWLAITHGDLDHVGGAASVAHDLAPREIWEGIPVPPNTELQALRSEAHEHGIVWRQLQLGHRVEVDGALVEVVNPPLPDWERRRVRNDDSLVLRLRFGDVEFLLTGDAGEEVERRLEPDETTVPVRILKVGHHGSLTSSSPAFVEGFAPAVALVSVGRHNTFGHPAPDVLARFNRIGAHVFRTDLDGAIVVETDGRQVVLKTMAGRTWTTRP